jgi:beta-alanine--pyruvate transaminase
MLPRVDHMAFIHDPQQHAYIEGELPQFSNDLLNELEQRILPLHDPSNVAAIIVEPVSGSAGWYIPPLGYLQRLRQICDKHGILLIFDEVITGLGRMGVPFAADYFGVVPDMLNFAKCVTNGVVPMGGVICREAIYHAVTEQGGPAHAIEFLHGYTYSGHPVACAAAVATLKLMAQERLFERAGQMGPLLGRAMHHNLKGLPHVVGIRSLGLAAAVELSPSSLGAGQRGYAVFQECLRRGVLVRSAGDNLVFAPPFIVEREHIEHMVATLADAIASLPA